MLIGIDLDSVLADVIPPLLEYHNKSYGTKLIFEDIKNHSLNFYFKTTKKEASNRIQDFYQRTSFKNIKPIDGSIPAIGKLSKKHKLLLITDRPKAIDRETVLWLEHFFPQNFNEVIYTRDTIHKEKVRKADICFDRKINCMIDDHLVHAVQCSSKGLDVLLMDRPWNKMSKLPPKVRRVSTWDEILNILDK